MRFYFDNEKAYSIIVNLFDNENAYSIMRDFIAIMKMLICFDNENAYSIMIFIGH